MPRPVRTAVFPVAGLGTRFLPATKAIPKELLTIVDKPALQYVVEEAKAAGIEHFVFVTGRGKSAIEDHFDVAYELEATLQARGKTEALEALRADLLPAGAVSFTRQQEPLGLGHAVWCARDIVGDQPFAVLLPDMVMKGEVPCLKQMIDVYGGVGGNVVAVEECDPNLTHLYGIVSTGDQLSDGVFAMTGMVEKPAPEDAPTNLFINGRYILQPEIFDLLATQQRGAGNEIQLTDAMLRLMDDQPFASMTYEGTTYDCGSKLGFITANVAYALERDDIDPELPSILRRLVHD